MVKQNIITRRQTHNRRQVQYEQARQMEAVVQNTLNALLWHIITEHAAAEADPDTEGKEVTAILTVPTEEIDKVPEGFALNVKFDPEKKVIQIHAMVQKEKSRIVLADGSHLDERTNDV